MISISKTGNVLSVISPAITIILNNHHFRQKLHEPEIGQRLSPGPFPIRPRSGKAIEGVMDRLVAWRRTTILTPKLAPFADHTRLVTLHFVIFCQTFNVRAWGCARLEAEELHCTWPKRRCWCRHSRSLSLSK